MKPEIKSIWLKALRSGKYKQTVKVLNDGSGYCCLGVLTDLAVKHGIGKWQLLNESRCFDFIDPITNTEERTTLSTSTRQWSGLESCNGQFRVEISEQNTNPVISLDELNDFAGMPFNQIADVIEYFF